MPLLHRKPFEREKPPADLRADEYVFYCRVTHEIFRDYDDFFERTILCNSLVWSCAVTGKSGLTYQEALESEKKARQNLQNFPEPLIVPVLYLVTRTERLRLHEVCDDIFAYITDRYFVGEIVEVHRNNGERLHCKILEVKAPLYHNGISNGHVNNVDGETIVISDSDDSDLDSISAQNGKEKTIIDPSLFKYKLKPIKKQLYESVTVKASQICRRKHLFSRNRLKLFLKQHCESHEGIVKIKATSVAKYKIGEQKFFHFFPDDPPTFIVNPSSKQQKKPSKIASDDLVDRAMEQQLSPSCAAKERARLQKERAMEKFKREKTNAVESKKREKEDKEKRKEELKKIVEEERLKKKEERERLKIEKEKEREKLREEKRKYLQHLKQWSKHREDMECDDLKELPVPTPVKTRLPPEIFGDAVMVLEFLHAFGELFDLQDEFPDGVTLDVLEEALVGNDSEGPLCELLFFFLMAIFQAIAEEEEEVAKDQIANAETKDLTEALDEDADPTKSALSAVATLAAAWPQLHQGCNLKNLDLDSCTLSEILRLHILASGADVTSANAKYRYQKRGGFDATDDACMELRLSYPGLLKKLSYIPVYDLSPGEKMKILHALCGKLLTLVSTRDFIEDSVDVLRQAKQEFRELKAGQHRRERKAAAARRIRKRKEDRSKGQEQKMKEKQEKLKEDQNNPSINVSVGEEQEELDTSTESKETETKEQDLDLDGLTSDEDDVVLNQKKRGGRRGHNGFKDFTRQEETTDEKCKPITSEEEEALKQEQQAKERELAEKIQKATACTNISPLGRDRLYRRYWSFPSLPGLFVEEDYSGLTEDMLMPQPPPFQNNIHGYIADKSQTVANTGESLKTESTSNVHQNLNIGAIVPVSQPIQKPNRWCFYSSQEQLDQLLMALNSRGYRESALKDVLLQEKSRIYEELDDFPVEKFHILEKAQNESKPPLGRGRTQNIHDACLMSAEKELESRLREFLLDIEDRIFQGTLGSVKVTDRQNWRYALENGQYEFLNEENKENGIVKSVSANVDDMEIDVQTKALVKDRLIGLKPEPRSTASTNTSTPQPANNAVHYLALALLQIEQGIERKFLKAPLGDAEENKRDQKGDKRRKREEQSSLKDDGSDGGRSHKTVLDRWRESLLSSASLSQIFLHLSTLERSVIWSKSILNARCKMCRKKGDAESMVLCDSCDRGYHIYCIRPKLKAVPDGDWFCPECRPKQHPKRLSSRQRSSLESDEDAEDQNEEEEDETTYEDIGQSEEEDYEEEDDNYNSDTQEEEEKSLSKPENPQIKFFLRPRAAKLTTTISSQGIRQQGTGKYNSQSQHNSPKTAGSSCKAIGKVIRKTKSAPPSVTKSSRPNSRITRHNQGLLQGEGFIELTGPHRQRRGRKTADNTPTNSPSASFGFRIVNNTLNSREQKSSSISEVKSYPQDTVPKTRGRKRQSTELSEMPLNRRSSGRQNGVHELSAFEQLVVELVRHDDSWPFMKLVSKIQVPDYYDIIKKPIALNVIREKVNKCEYKLASEFIEDVELMFSNCFEYNPRNTNEAKAGTRLQAFFHVQAQKLGLPVASGYMNYAAPATKKSRI